MSVLELPAKVDALADLCMQLKARVDELEQRPTPANLQPNVLTDTPAGIGALFPGGVQIPLGSQESFPPSSSDALSWVRQSDGVLIAEIDASQQDAGNQLIRHTIKPGRGGAQGNSSAFQLELLDSSGLTEILSLLISQVNDGFGSGNPGAGHEIGLRGSNIPAGFKIFRASDHASNFLQLLSTQKLQIQIGSAANLAVDDGFNNIAVNLATPWPGQHTLFLPFINGSNIFGSIEYVGSNTPSLTQGSILLQSSAAGTINVAYASLGN